MIPRSIRQNLLIILLTLINFPYSNAQNELIREFRGVWVATVHNIDWPTEPGLSTDEQKAQLIELLDSYKKLNLNSVIFQIRPAADSYYPSKFEPWSAWLTGKQGVAPDPFYDPLEFAIFETHKRGMEFHAWLNPYRASSNTAASELAISHIVNTHPEWILDYGNNKYLDPGIPEVRAYTNEVVRDIVNRYDVDAIHFDDYFYPYKIEGSDFPDNNSFKTYGDIYYPDRLADWRRDNVDRIIQELRATIKSTKPWVQFGISPFGVWRNSTSDPTGSKTLASQTNYDDLYADILLWVKMNWIDYVVPQAYWHIGFEIADYRAISSWWNENSFDTNLYIGQSVSRLNSDRAPEWKAYPKTEIEKQLDYNKSLPHVKGTVYFNGSTFLKNPLNIVNRLQENYYKFPVLPPVVFKNIPTTPKMPVEPRLKKKGNGIWKLSWTSPNDSPDKKGVKFLIYSFADGKIPDFNDPKNLMALTGETEFNLPDKTQNATLAIVAVNKNNRCSVPVFLNW